MACPGGVPGAVPGDRFLKRENIVFKVKVIKNGGWHFTNIKTAEEIHNKMKNFLHHYEYENSGLNTRHIEKLIKNKKALYNYSADQRVNKWTNNSELEKINLDYLPKYINENKLKYKDWLS